jgi:hypothetical protein
MFVSPSYVPDLPPCVVQDSRCVTPDSAGRHVGQRAVQPGWQVEQEAAQRHTAGQRLLWGWQVREAQL